MTINGKRHEILSLTNEKVKIINSLSQRKYRKDLNLFVAEGTRICREAIDNSWKIKYILYNKKSSDNYIINSLVDEL